MTAKAEKAYEEFHPETEKEIVIQPPRDQMSDEEIVQLAKDCCAGRVFGTWHVAEHDSSCIPMIFMAFALSGGDYSEQLKVDDVVHFYEYIDKAGPRGVNGYPSFFSHATLTRKESERLAAAMKKDSRDRKSFS